MGEGNDNPDSKGNELEIAKLLLDNGANISIPDNYGGQPLWYAVFYVRKEEDLQLIKLLLDNGANPDYKGNGQSPLDFAIKVGYQPMIEILKKSKK